MIADSPVFTVEEAAKYLGLDRLGCESPQETVGYLIKSKQLRFIKVAGRRAFMKHHLDEYLARCEPEK